jgi:hypothetical protein
MTLEQVRRTVRYAERAVEKYMGVQGAEPPGEVTGV